MSAGARGLILVASAVCLMGGVPGCGPDPSAGDAGSSGTTAADVSAGPSSTAADGTASTGESAATLGTGTTGEPPGAYEDSGSGTGCLFTCPPPAPPPGPPGGGGFAFCDLATQNCPEGEKCMPWAIDGGDRWNSTRCSPLADDPGQPGEMCTVEGNGYSGIDDCDLGLMCWQVDPKTNQGTCFAMCGLLDPGVLCPDGESCVSVDIMSLCVQSCDPFAQDCGFDAGCFPSHAGFVCQATAWFDLAIGQPCTSSPACGAGELCAHGPGYDCGGAPGSGCCAEVCATDAPSPCPGPDACIPWYTTDPPPALANLGTCPLP